MLLLPDNARCNLMKTASSNRVHARGHCSTPAVCDAILVQRRLWSFCMIHPFSLVYGCCRWLGTFDTAQEAAKAYDAAARQIRGATARCNFALDAAEAQNLQNNPPPGVFCSSLI